MPLTRRQLAAHVDDAVLSPTAIDTDVIRACSTANWHGFAGTCVAPVHAALAAQELNGPACIVVVGFPTGAHRPEIKALEARRAVEDGADELDVVLALGRLREGNRAAVLDDLAGVVDAAQGRPVKAILETALLSDGEIDAACAIAEEAGARFVKTSTGFGPGGATVEAVRRLRRNVGDRLGVKASGGIRTLEQALALLEAGADRLGTSRALEILGELPGDQESP